MSILADVPEGLEEFSLQFAALQQQTSDGAFRFQLKLLERGAAAGRDGPSQFQLEDMVDALRPMLLFPVRPRHIVDLDPPYCLGETEYERKSAQRVRWVWMSLAVEWMPPEARVRLPVFPLPLAKLEAPVHTFKYMLSLTAIWHLFFGFAIAHLDFGICFFVWFSL